MSLARETYQMAKFNYRNKKLPLDKMNFIERPKPKSVAWQPHVPLSCKKLSKEEIERICREKGYPVASNDD